FFIEAGETKLLVDAGLSGKQIEKQFASIERNLEDVTGILVTHEHSDHIKGLGVLARRYNLPIYANKKTWEQMDSKIGKITTDIGYVSERIKKTVEGADAYIFEANHDINMLQMCHYPWSVKQRILGDSGHISNEDSGLALSEIISNDTKRIYLAHLSQDNNMK